MRERRVFDRGLQPERTELAWRRTSLALAVAGLASMRVFPPVLGSWSIAVGVAGLALAVTGWASASHRSRRVRRALLAGDGALPDGRLLLLTAALVAAMAALGLLHIGS